MGTLTGNKDDIDILYNKIKNSKTSISKDVFMKHIHTNGFAYHSQQLDVCINPLKKLITNLKYRKNTKSNKWISTLENNTFDDNYWINTFRNTVHFSKAIKQVPDNTIFIEIGPNTHLKQFIPKHNHYINLMKKN